MNQAQRNHFIQRVSVIKQEKIKKVKEPFFVEGKDLGEKAMVNLILEKKVKIKKNEELKKTRFGYGHATDVFKNLFDFSKYCWNPYHKKGWEKKVETIEKEADRIVDTAMFCDCSEALDLLEAFNKI